MNARQLTQLQTSVLAVGVLENTTVSGLSVTPAPPSLTTRVPRTSTLEADFLGYRCFSRATAALVEALPVTLSILSFPGQLMSHSLPVS